MMKFGKHQLKFKIYSELKKTLKLGIEVKVFTLIYSTFQNCIRDMVHNGEI